MHIPITALYVIAQSLLGGSKTAHPDPDEDAFGVSNYDIQCQDRVYPNYVIHEAAKNYCDINKKEPNFSDRHSAALGFQTRFYYYFSPRTNINELLKNSHYILPILEDGTLYPLEPVSGFVKNSAGKMVKKAPGPDRLVIDKNCNIIGAFSDFYYAPEKDGGRIEKCKILKSAIDNSSPSVRSPERSRNDLRKDHANYKQKDYQNYLQDDL